MSLPWLLTLAVGTRLQLPAEADLEAWQAAAEHAGIVVVGPAQSAEVRLVVGTGGWELRSTGGAVAVDKPLDADDREDVALLAASLARRGPGLALPTTPRVPSKPPPKPTVRRPASTAPVRPDSALAASRRATQRMVRGLSPVPRELRRWPQRALPSPSPAVSPQETPTWTALVGPTTELRAGLEPAPGLALSVWTGTGRLHATTSLHLQRSVASTELDATRRAHAIGLGLGHQATARVHLGAGLQSEHRRYQTATDIEEAHWRQRMVTEAGLTVADAGHGALLAGTWLARDLQITDLTVAGSAAQRLSPWSTGLALGWMTRPHTISRKR